MREGIEQIILQQLNDAGTASASELHAGLEAEPEFDGVSLPVFRAHVSFMKTKSGSVESFGQGTKAKYALTAVGRVILGLEPPAPEFKIPVASESTGEWVPVEPPVDSIIAEYPNDLLEDATGFPGDILSDTETAPERVIGDLDIDIDNGPVDVDQIVSEEIAAEVIEDKFAFMFEGMTDEEALEFGEYMDNRHTRFMGENKILSDILKPKTIGVDVENIIYDLQTGTTQFRELQSMDVIAGALDKLTSVEVQRVMRWIKDKYGPFI